jgi:hypothetical protein
MRHSFARKAAWLAALSRAYIGYHFRYATVVGLAQGRAVGDYVAAHALRPLHHGLLED